MLGNDILYNQEEIPHIDHPSYSSAWQNNKLPSRSINNDMMFSSARFNPHTEMQGNTINIQPNLTQQQYVNMLHQNQQQYMLLQQKMLLEQQQRQQERVPEYQPHDFFINEHISQKTEQNSNNQLNVRDRFSDNKTEVPQEEVIDNQKEKSEEIIDNQITESLSNLKIDVQTEKQPIQPRESPPTEKCTSKKKKCIDKHTFIDYFLFS